MIQRSMPHLHLSLSSIVTRSEGFIDSEIDNEIVAVNMETESGFRLNRAGSRIWNLVSTPTRIGDICSALMREYDVDREVCERQVLDLLEQLRAEGMIIARDEP